ncbi:CLUMA_CG013119, isoform A [Clunio marinus]|uniref:CLUMA_CG013119, isoform A n=1 Tax=Clunio marinus TaxID=568069 RepID=A0A1J1IHX1_9DIPT|nr:CLUMA_CG013119, isoform A [Clunio marinus]
MGRTNCSQQVSNLPVMSFYFLLDTYLQNGNSARSKLVPHPTDVPMMMETSVNLRKFKVVIC